MRYFLFFCLFESVKKLRDSEFDCVFAVLVLVKGSKSLYHGMMNCLKPQFRYIKLLLPLGTGIIQLHVMCFFLCVWCLTHVNIQH
jgi:hypothetical protein